MLWTDPSGQTVYLSQQETVERIQAIAEAIEDVHAGVNLSAAVIGGAGVLTFAGLAKHLGAGLTGTAGAFVGAKEHLLIEIGRIKRALEYMNNPDGFAIGAMLENRGFGRLGVTVAVMNRSSGDKEIVRLTGIASSAIPPDFYIGTPHASSWYELTRGNYWFAEDFPDGPPFIPPAKFYLSDEMRQRLAQAGCTMTQNEDGSDNISCPRYMLRLDDIALQYGTIGC